MTLIVGIKCQTGVVLGADGAATLGSLGQRTVRQSVTSKLQIVGGNVVVGVSGPMGLGQRIVGEIASLWRDPNFPQDRPHESMTALRGALFDKHIGPELRAAALAKEAIGPQLAMQSAVTATLVAMPIKFEVHLFQFDQQGAPEEATKDLPFVAIGSGQSIADPFLAFLRRIFWPKELPTISEGIFAAIWTLDHAIQTNPGGVSDPVQMITLDWAGNSCKATELGEAEFQEHREAIGAAEDSLKNFRSTLGSAVGTAPTPPPPVP